jgi:hypothetical protein
MSKQEQDTFRTDLMNNVMFSGKENVHLLQIPSHEGLGTTKRQLTTSPHYTRAMEHLSNSGYIGYKLTS